MLIPLKVTHTAENYDVIVIISYAEAAGCFDPVQSLHGECVCTLVCVLRLECVFNRSQFELTLKPCSTFHPNWLKTNN